MVYDLVTIDPGKRMGVACFTVGYLVKALLVRNWKQLPYGPLHTKNLAIEIPEIRVQGGGKGDPNDMVRLAFAVGIWAQANVECAGVVQLVRPFAWKGNVPKAIFTDRIKAAKSLGDIDPGKDHNVLDAVGLGYYVLRGRV